MAAATGVGPCRRTVAKESRYKAERRRGERDLLVRLSSERLPDHARSREGEELAVAT